MNPHSIVSYAKNPCGLGTAASLILLLLSEPLIRRAVQGVRKEILGAHF